MAAVKLDLAALWLGAYTVVRGECVIARVGVEITYSTTTQSRKCNLHVSSAECIEKIRCESEKETDSTRLFNARVA